MLDVKRLRVLREVAARGSFSAAAESLSYTQPAVSQQIAALEREAGTTLVERGARGIRLTDAGRALVEHADAILSRLSAAEAELDAIAGLRGGRVRLASFSTAGATLVPLAVATYTKRHPAVELSLIEAEPEDGIPRMKAGELDIVLTFEYSTLPRSASEPHMEGTELHPLLVDPMHVALPLDHPLVRKRTIRLEDLREESWVQGDPEDICGRFFIAACHIAGFEPLSGGFQSGDYAVIQGLVAAGVGIALIPELALATVRDDIVVRSLGKQAPLRHVSAVTVEGAYRSPAVGAMLDVLEESARQYERERMPLRAAS